MKHGPTVQGIVDELRSHGVDRGTVVRPAKDGKPAALAIFLLTNAAVREVGPYLRTVFAAMPPQPTRVIAFADGESHVMTAIEAVEEAGQFWCYAPIFADRPGMMVILARDAVTYEVADNLTARGCTTNLK